jgi:ATP-dependent protease Clp ATPase subunit
MLDTMYLLPSEDDIEKVIVDEDVVNLGKEPKLIKKNIA